MDDHLTRLSPVILNLESTGFTHLESEIQVSSVTDLCMSYLFSSFIKKMETCFQIRVEPDDLFEPL